MYYKDLSLYAYKLTRPVKSIRTIGWLDAGEAFSTGKAPSDFLSKLKSVIIGNKNFDVNFNRIRGLHRCSLCGERGQEIEINGEVEVLGMGEILVPTVDGNGYFASPSMVYHYIVQHNYMPPAQYLSAVNSIDLGRKYSADDIFDELLTGGPSVAG